MVLSAVSSRFGRPLLAAVTGHVRQSVSLSQFTAGQFTHAGVQ